MSTESDAALYGQELPSARPLGTDLNARLSVMMFLQYGIWGAWLPILYPFLLGHRGFSLDQCGMILAAGAVGAIIGPFIAGQIADRHFATEKFLAISHLAGAVLVWFLSGVTDFAIFLGLSLLYGLIYAPTLALTNSLAFHHLPDRDRDFGKVRVWGTIGWIVVGIGMGHWLGLMHTPAGGTEDVIRAAQDAGRADAFKLSAILGAVMAVYCLTLPHTPPAKEAAQKSATLGALGDIAQQPLLTLFLLAVPISMIHQFYFVHTSAFLSDLQRRATEAEMLAKAINRILGVGGGGLMTIGQMTEILVLAGMPIIAKQTPRKALLALGIVAYGARMALFAYTTSMPAIVLGVALHGFCFGCFIFVAFMVVDEETTSDVRASAQNLFNLVIVGIGIIVGSWFATSVVGNWATHPAVNAAGTPQMDAAGKPIMATNYTELFSVPMWIAIGCLAVLLLVYPGGRRQRPVGDAV
jgi:nucleoside transporter